MAMLTSKLLRTSTPRIIPFIATTRFFRKPPNFTTRRIVTTKVTSSKQEDTETEDVYKLGCTRNDLQRVIDDETTTSLREYESETAAYQRYQRLASNLNIDLPDIPSQVQKEREEMKTFILQQIDTAEKQMQENKSQRLAHLYSAAGKFDECYRILVNGTENAWFKALPRAVDEVRRAARNLDVDLNGNLSQLENIYNFDVGWVRKIQKKLCKAASETPQRSEIHPGRVRITDEIWAVSLVQLNYKHHVFLVLEGKACNKSMIWLIDFVANDAMNLLPDDLTHGKVRIDYYESEEVLGPNEKLLFQSDKMMLRMRRGARIRHSTWSIGKPTAKLLLENLRQQQDDPPRFKILGDSKLGESWATTTNTHNCFSFVRKMLYHLDDDFIKIPQNTLDEWIEAADRRVLTDV